MGALPGIYGPSIGLYTCQGDHKDSGVAPLVPGFWQGPSFRGLGFCNMESTKPYGSFQKAISLGSYQEIQHPKLQKGFRV